MPGWCHKGPCEGSQWPCATFIAAAGQQQSACPHGRSTGKMLGVISLNARWLNIQRWKKKRSRMWFAHIIATDCACDQQWVSSLHTVLPLGTGSKLKHTEEWCATFSLYSNKHKEHCHDFEASPGCGGHCAAVLNTCTKSGRSCSSRPSSAVSVSKYLMDGAVAKASLTTGDTSDNLEDKNHSLTIFHTHFNISHLWQSEIIR